MHSPRWLPCARALQKLAAEEQGRRANDLKMLVREVKRVQGLAKGEVVSGADEEEGASRGEFGARIIRAGDLEKDAKPGAPLRVQQEAMTGQQQAQLTQVRAIMQEQDDMLDQISEALDGLKETSQAIGDELTAQTQMLADTEEHMDETQNKLDSVKCVCAAYLRGCQLRPRLSPPFPCAATAWTRR